MGKVLTVGDKAPSFALLANGGNKISMESLLGKWLILYFYPKDDTSGCTKEAIEFTRLLKKFGKLGAVVVGVSKDDVFEIKGDNTSKIKITIAGGLGEDTYNFSNGKNVIVYDQEHQDNVVKEENGARFRINDVYENHIYDPERRPSSGSVFGLNVAYNPDLGAVTKLLVGKETLKFERNPFTKKFDLLTTYYPLTQAVSFEGSAQFAHLFHDWNLKISSRVTSNNYTENFFGFGNSTDNPFSNYDANRIYTRQM